MKLNIPSIITFENIEIAKIISQKFYKKGKETTLFY